MQVEVDNRSIDQNHSLSNAESVELRKSIGLEDANFESEGSDLSGK